VPRAGSRLLSTRCRMRCSEWRARPRSPDHKSSRSFGSTSRLWSLNTFTHTVYSCPHLSPTVAICFLLLFFGGEEEEEEEEGANSGYPPTLRQLNKFLITSDMRAIKYVKTHDLQNPNNKSEILCDAPLVSFFFKAVLNYHNLEYFLLKKYPQVFTFTHPVQNNELSHFRRNCSAIKP